MSPSTISDRTLWLFPRDAVLTAVVFLFRDVALIAQVLISCELSFMITVLPGRVQAGVILHEIVMDCGSVAILEQRREHDQQVQADA